MLCGLKSWRVCYFGECIAVAPSDRLLLNNFKERRQTHHPMPISLCEPKRTSWRVASSGSR